MEYFLVGIKGSGMASLAQILLDLNYKVSGSDIEQHIFTQDVLEKRDVPIYSFNAQNIKEGMIIVKGNSFDENHPEIKEAKRLDLKIYTYVEMLQKIIGEYYSICIAGTHGKTTTTGLVETILAGKEKTGFLIGDGNGQLSSDAINFVVESCEYKDNFLNYYPNIALINNIELDHVDYFDSLEQYILSFKKFAQQSKDYVVLNGDDNNCMKIERENNYYYFGLSDNNCFQAKNIVYDENGVEFDLYSSYFTGEKEFCYRFKLKLYGAHMLMNALAAITIYSLKNIDSDFEYMEKALNSFEGVSRRFEIKEEKTNVFVDDYAHHPTAIKLMIDTVKQKYPNKKVIAFFKPDRYSRIYEFGKEIAQALSKADEVYLFEFPSTSAKEVGIDIDMNYVLQYLDKGKIIEENQESINHFKGYQDSIFLLMSSKNVYDFEEKLIKSI
ncbi:UDP-N-acetylmuramate--alanine ligase [Bacilli bacterium PM5-3]|nr:UDP-N-acetylmuramate--alanine ligase [Bacilli bacterium PM5-3]MDH6603822.1 UDP-N-acetylmuramate--alanine ligase [Bacilli bacterium PM5-9]